MITEIFKKVLILSIAGSIVALALLILRSFFWRRMPARLQYALWALLIIRLLLPAAPSNPLSLFAFSAPSFAAHQCVGIVTDVPKGTQAPMINFGLNYETAAVIWILGVAALFLYFFIVNLAMRIVFSRRQCCCDRTVTTVLNDCRTKLNLHTPVRIICDERAESPGVFGVLRPQIIISKTVLEQVNAAELRYILMHEFTHVKRHDNAVNLVIILLEAVNWFNPLLWYAFNKMKEDCEISCDASVLAALCDDERRAYGNTIISVLQAMPKTSLIPGMAGFTSNFSRRRIVMIANSNKKISIISIAVVLTAAMLAGCASLPRKVQKTAQSGSKSVSALSTPVAEFPTTVKATFSDGTTKDVKVTWDIPVAESPVTVKATFSDGTTKDKR